MATESPRLRRAKDELNLLVTRMRSIQSVSKDTDSKELADKVWFCYLSLEKAIAWLKLEIRYDAHNQRREVKSIKDNIPERVSVLRKDVSSAILVLEMGHYVEAIQILGKVRDAFGGLILGLRSRTAKQDKRKTRNQG